MGILDKIYHVIFGGEDKQENSEFDLKELKENLRRAKEREAEKKKPVHLESNEKPQNTDGRNSEIIREIIWRDDWAKNYFTPENSEKRESADKLSSETRELRNPPLLGVKMFLADVIYMVNMPYIRDSHNCSHFAKDVQNVAGKQGIRCGYVRINFKEKETGHAIVAFETDYGLKFFEPQDAEERSVTVGYHYSGNLSENFEDGIISKVEIFWNDGTNTLIE
jgi:hypothetical protein